MKQKINTVDAFIQHFPDKSESLQLLRKILLDTELDENIKWGAPTYSLNQINVVGIGAFQSYVGLWFYQGVFLKDKSKLLVNASEGKTKGMRQLRFYNAGDIDTNTIVSYVKEAIENARQGKKILIEKGKPVVLPQILKNALEHDSELAACFDAISTAKQREYAEYIDEAKRDATKHERIQKIIPMVRAGVGLNDKYKKK